LRKSSTFTQEGAEKLVLSSLLIRDIECYQAYENQKSYDLIAVSQNGKKIAKIEVKSRQNNHAKKITNSNFMHKKPPFPDFYVSVFIKSFRENQKVTDNELDVEMLVLPKNIVHSKKHTHVGKKGSYFYPNKLKDIDKYVNNFELITNFLKD
tara:strand:- start:731 stop:1186 length:456 start_codon:yes stop_codon:yes gene_type:complete